MRQIMMTVGPNRIELTEEDLKVLATGQEIQGGGVIVALTRPEPETRTIRCSCQATELTIAVRGYLSAGDVRMPDARCSRCQGWLIE